MTPSLSTYSFPTKIRFGPGARTELPTELAALGVRRPLVVTDKDVAKLPWFTEVVALAGPTAQTFSGVWGNPVAAQVSAGVAAYQDHGADGIVAVGGGAPIDVAKAIALMAHHPGHLFDYEDGACLRPMDQPIPAIAAIPTTAGTGSEVGRSAVISDDSTHAKKIIFDPRLLPQVVLADPELLLGLPAKVTAATGMDALTHLIEAFLARGNNPLCDGIALEGIYLVAQHLKAAVDFAQHGGERTAHLVARAGMLNASMMGAIAFQKGLGVTHSCAHALSTVCDTHHGLANAVMLPAALRFNLAAVPDKFLRLARVVLPGVTHGEALIDWVETLARDVGIPALGAIGVDSETLERLVPVAMADGCHLLNPRPVTATDIFAIYQDALGA